MASTRFNYDECRTKKRLQQATDPGRWILNVPGNGDKPAFIEDPQIRIQKWGANLQTNAIHLESELFGVNRQINSRDCFKQNYKNYNVFSETIQYPSNNVLSVGESRTTNPAWWYRDLEQVDWYYPPINPQENTCIPFETNLNTRIIEKDNFTPKRDCLMSEVNNYLPISTNLVNNR